MYCMPDMCHANITHTFDTFFASSSRNANNNKNYVNIFQVNYIRNDAYGVFVCRISIFSKKKRQTFE